MTEVKLIKYFLIQLLHDLIARCTSSYLSNL